MDASYKHPVVAVVGPTATGKTALGVELAKHFENGAKKYEERNWEKGIPTHSFIDSAIRHLMKYLDGATDEDHLCAAAWNCMCCMWTEEKRPDLIDIPARLHPLVDTSGKEDTK